MCEDEDGPLVVAIPIAGGSRDAIQMPDGLHARHGDCHERPDATEVLFVQVNLDLADWSA